MQTPSLEERRGNCSIAEVATIDIKDSLRPEDVDLHTLVSHQAAVYATDTVDSVFTTFGKSGVEFVAVLDDERLVGLCSRHQISQLVSGRYGFALWARKPIAQHLSPKETRVCVTTPIGDVLREVFARSNDAFYDDILLVDEDGLFLGLITTQTLFKVQDALLRNSIRDLLEKEREIEGKNRQMENDLRMATELQQALMPVTYPVFRSKTSFEETQIRFSHLYTPCDVIGGDFFYIVRVSDSCAGIFICDVMGHGVRSALITSMLRALIEGLGSKVACPDELMTLLNNELASILRQTGTVLFATALYCVLDSANGELRFACAGHPHPLHVRGTTGDVFVLEGKPKAAGLALGLLPGVHYDLADFSLSPGDSVLLFTDGIIEAEDCHGREFGMDRLVESLRRAISNEDSLLDSIEQDVRLFTGDEKFKDDVCLVLAQWVPESKN